MTHVHIPRRSGVGARTVLVPKQPKAKAYRRRPVPAAQCGAVHPERPGIVDDVTGELLADPVFCTAQVKYRDGKPVRHRGPHRARVLRGVLVRWEDAR